ncbi:MAG: translocation and assembly module protein TamB [Pseudorhodobacter sp.]|nr:MAG: translocation and assembly module protein TamB [Pseudorhodobacter sp.]
MSDIIADLALSTDDKPRLTGRIVTKSSLNGTGFAANLSGDIAPLFLPDYATFFGNQIRLIGSGTAHADGRIDLSKLTLNARALDLTGSLSLSADGRPARFDLTGVIAQGDQTPVLLPLSTDLPVRINRGDFSLRYDRAKGDDWSATSTVRGFDRDDMRISSLSLTGSGRIAPDQLGGTLQFVAEGVDPTDPALAKAIGSVVTGEIVAFRRAGAGRLAIPKLAIWGEDYSATVTGATVAGLSEALKISGKLSARLDNLARLDALAGRPLAGAISTDISGTFQVLGGAFDMTATAEGQDLKAGQTQLDGLLRGKTRLNGRLIRDATGLRLVDGRLVGNGVAVNLGGLISSTASDLAGTARIADLSVLGPGFGGALQGEARLTGPLGSAHIAATAIGQRLRVDNAEVNKLLAGESRLTADLDLRSGRVQINRATLVNPELRAEIAGTASGATQELQLTAGLRNLGLLVPDFPGPMTVTGTALRSAAGTQVQLVGKGPGGIDATLAGRLGAERNDLTLRGSAQAALANAFILPRSVSGQLGFDLRLNGPLALSSVSGPVTLSGARLSDPGLPFGLQDISGRADLAGGLAKLAFTLPVSTGGKLAVAGTVGLAEPYSAALGIAVQGVTLRDPDLYEARMNGEMTLSGPLLARPLLSGQITLGETELRVPSTGFGGAAGLPELRHINEPADVRATRRRAGLLEDAAKAARAGQGDLALDLTISAPNRLFIRGRGLDAELGGEVRLLGSLSALSHSGAFNLIRGRLDILGKRFDLSEALLQLEGDLIPFLRIVASTVNDSIIASVVIEGRADDPKVSFTSMPELPEEEVLAQLLFGQDLQNLSALQALQLASAVATLAGRGGVGVIAKLRQGIGIDNLDVKTTAEGGTELTAGKYIGKNAYTEVTVGQDGKSQINLNLDLTDSITLRGRAGSDGQTGIGVFVEKDY